MEDYRLPTPLVGMLRAANLTEQPSRQISPPPTETIAAPLTAAITYSQDTNTATPAPVPTATLQQPVPQPRPAKQQTHPHPPTTMPIQHSNYAASHLLPSMTSPCIPPQPTLPMTRQSSHLSSFSTRPREVGMAYPFHDKYKIGKTWIE